MVERIVERKGTIQRLRNKIGLHRPPSGFPRRPHIGPLDQAQRELFRRLLIGRVQRIAHEMVPTRPPSTKMVLPVV